MVNKRSKKEDRIYECKKCGKVKEAIYPSYKKDFCSHKCSNIWMWENTLERGNYIPCFECGKLTWTPRRYFKNPDKYIKEGRFCSNNCFYKFRKGTKLPQISKGLKKTYASGKISPWNKGKIMSNKFKEKCKARAIDQWKDLDYREKQMKRDFSKQGKIGAKALKHYRESNKGQLKNGGKTVGKNYLKKKLGIKI